MSNFHIAKSTGNAKLTCNLIQLASKTNIHVGTFVNSSAEDNLVDNLTEVNAGNNGKLTSFHQTTRYSSTRN